MSNPLHHLGTSVLDQISAFTGYAATRVPLQQATTPNEVTLKLPGYRQLDSYSCGAIAVAMVTKFLRPAVSFERCYTTVNPQPRTGAGTQRVLRALRSLGLKVLHRHHLTFAALRAAIDAGCPVLVCVQTAEPHIDHWVVLYGYGQRPNLVFIAGQGLPFLSRQRMSWSDFRQQWTPRGVGLVCWKTAGK